MHRLYYSINYEDYDVGTSEWSRSHTVRSYTTVLSHDRNSRLIYPDKKVFLPESKLRELQTEFGFDDDYTGAKRKRRAQQDDRGQGGIQQTLSNRDGISSKSHNKFLWAQGNDPGSSNFDNGCHGRGIKVDYICHRC